MRHRDLCGRNPVQRVEPAIYGIELDLCKYCIQLIASWSCSLKKATKSGKESKRGQGRGRGNRIEWRGQWKW